MNGLLSLCHFCEICGPSVIFLTQCVHNKDLRKMSKIDLQQSTQTRNCKACLDFPGPLYDNILGFMTIDGGVTYKSTTHPIYKPTFAMLRKACVRSLSCEVSVISIIITITIAITITINYNRECNCNLKL